MRRLLLLALAVMLPASLAAQSPAATPPRNAVMSAFEGMADLFASRLVAAFDSIPAFQYDFHPTPAQQSVGYIAQHLEGANYGLCSRLGALKHPVTAKDALSDSVRARWPKDTLVTRLKASVRFCQQALAQLPTLENGGQARTLLLFETDLAEHYSQLSGYMRLLGLVPPSAVPPRQHTAIDLPASELSAYVGTYQLDETQQLDILLRDGLMYATSTGGLTLRLWPESRTDFFLKEVDAQVTFVRDLSGVVTGIVVHQNGRDRVAPKVR